MTGKKIFITGSTGLLGSCLVNNLNFNNISGISINDIDILDNKLLIKKLNEEKPDVIIHTAAYTNVDECEKNIDKAYKVNVIGTQNLVNYCIDKDVLFVYISSTGVYGNNKTEAYTEFDEVNPTTIHHKSKYEGEKVIQNHLKKFLIIRTGWLYGGEITQDKNFVYKRYLEAINNKVLYSDNSQVGNPTYVVDLVTQIELLILKNQYGVFNCVNTGIEISRYDYVKKIIDLFKINSEVRIAPKGMFNRIANVSNNESASNYKLELLGINRMNNWQLSLAAYINEINKNL
jgi:dTDP-4-dehydrorhamnose reductase